MASPTLWPAPDDVQVDRIITDEQSLTLIVQTYRKRAACPDCSQPSERAHSRYQRTLADLPWHGVSVRLRLQTCRFFCTNSACQRRIFTQRLPALVEPYARRTLPLQEALHILGLALGGRAGARLIQGLGLMVPRDTFLRLVRKQPFGMPPTPRVLGVDDWAFRRGHHYGTILIDLERHRRVDLLPDRSAETLASWLKAHRGVEIISRDRSPLYAQGARQGAPNAIHVADRWHLLKNLVDTLEGLLLREHRAVREAVQGARPPEQKANEILLVTTRLTTTRVITERLAREKQHRRERRLVRYEEVQLLFRQGHSVRAISHITGLSRKTVRRFVPASEFPERAIRQPRPTKLAAFSDYLLRRWDSGCHNSVQLYREICERGYTGKHTQVRDALSSLRRRAEKVDDSQRASQENYHGNGRFVSSAPPPSARSILWWLLRPDEQLEEEPRQFVTRLCDISPPCKPLANWRCGSCGWCARGGPTSSALGLMRPETARCPVCAALLKSYSVTGLL